MQSFSRWPEAQARLVRWILLIGWLLLIASLLVGVPFPNPWMAECPPGVACALHDHPGNRLFWGVVVPAGVLVIVVGSHELWRRICPLAFVSQLFRALGLQRRRIGRGGRPDLVSVERSSWLGRHHVQLQWSLLIAGLVLRLVLVNSQPLALGLLLLITVLAAVAVGWAYGGKAWCQYVCPMAPVQQVLIGPRSLLGGSAHVGTTSRITQSMCRTVAEGGGEKLACVGCQAPCIDIDSEKTFWQNLSGKAGLDWAWLSYPGLVLAFFLLMRAQSAALGAPLATGLWAFDASLPRRSLEAGLLGLPRLVDITALLVLAAAASVLLFRGLEAVLRRRLEAGGLGSGEAAAIATPRVRLLATFLAVNLFFWFADPSQGLLGRHGGELIRSLVLVVSGVWLYRSWHRDAGLYRRESQLSSLRRQLLQIVSPRDLQSALAGRRLEDISANEVFTLVQALPRLSRSQARAAYREVMADQLRTGRIDRAASLLQLEELRQSLRLEEEDHHEVVRQLASEAPELLDRDARQRQIDELRLEAALENLREFMAAGDLTVLRPDALSAGQAERLEQLRVESALEDSAWTALLRDLGPGGEQQRLRLEERRASACRELALAEHLRELAREQPLLRPLTVAMTQRWESAREVLDPELREAGLPELPGRVAAAGELGEAFDLLWQDPDPDTAGWVLMVERQLAPQRVGDRLREPRTGLADSPFLVLQRQGEPHPDGPEFPVLCRSSWLSDLPPAGILDVAAAGELRSWPAGATIVACGEPSTDLIVTLEGEAVLRPDGERTIRLGPGETIGELGLILDSPRSVDVLAGPEGLRGFVLEKQAFESLLQRSRRFSRSLLRLMARRLRA
jgi:hypothetical protein